MEAASQDNTCNLLCAAMIANDFTWGCYKCIGRAGITHGNLQES